MKQKKIKVHYQCGNCGKIIDSKMLIFHNDLIDLVERWEGELHSKGFYNFLVEIKSILELKN